MDVVLLSRLQFAFTVAFHFLLVPLSLGTSLVLLFAERRHYKTRDPADKATADFWIRLFTTTFVVGVATGIAMEFAFGANWASYSRFVGDIFGAPLAAEGVFAFFLESTFLGVLLFGRKRVGAKLYYVSSWLVFAGAHLSALWIIIANSWQQTPAGYRVEGGRAVLTDFFAAALNPSTLPRYFHTVASTWLMGAFVLIGIAAYYRLRGRHADFSRSAMRTGLALALVMSLAMPAIGHWHAVQVADTQPVKLAAFEGQFETRAEAPLYLFGWVDEETQTTKGLAVPGLLSWLVGFRSDTVIEGLNEVAPSEWPPLQLTFQTYHVMVLLGLYFVALAVAGLLLERSGRLERSKGWLRLMLYSSPLPMVAIQTGWAAAEVGRQPWIVQGELRTADAVSAVVPASQVATTLALFVLVYAVLFTAWSRVALRIVHAGPVEEPGLAPAPAPGPVPRGTGTLRPATFNDADAVRFDGHKEV